MAYKYWIGLCLTELDRVSQLHEPSTRYSETCIIPRIETIKTLSQSHTTITITITDPQTSNP